MLLVVDDNEDLLEMLGMLFGHADIPHVTARSLDEVKALGDQLRQVTSAILDVTLGRGMPDGVSVAAWLREQRPTVQIVFTTSHAPEHPLLLEASRSSQVFTKPVETAVLIKFARSTT